MATTQEIIALENKRWDTVIAGDWKALEAMVHDELVYTHAHAKVDNKASYLAGLKSAQGKIRSIRRSDEQVRVFGDTAYIAGALASEVEADGTTKVVRVRFISIWTRAAAGWQFAGWQTTAQA